MPMDVEAKRLPVNQAKFNLDTARNAQADFSDAQLAAAAAMYDGIHLPLEQNIKGAAYIAKIAHAMALEGQEVATTTSTLAWLRAWLSSAGGEASVTRKSTSLKEAI